VQTPAAFEYERATSVEGAIASLARLGPDARIIAGGHSLIPMMKLRLAMPAHLVDLAGISELKGVRADGNDVVIGAMVTQHELVASELLTAKVPLLRETSLQVADPQVRYVGTIGGNVAETLALSTATHSHAVEGRAADLCVQPDGLERARARAAVLPG
jgi:carbon-monoxide dehydrogenase medium subunit